MKFIETKIQGVWLIEPELREDPRGRFFRAWCTREFSEHGISFMPIQANMGFSIHKGTLRGMHVQVDPAPEAKLIRCTRGAIFDVAVDLRSDSPTYRKWFGAELSAENGRMLYVPELCAHGYQTLEDQTEMFYLTSQFYAPATVRGVRFDDEVLQIHWPLEVAVISQQDRNWPLSSR